MIIQSFNHIHDNRILSYCVDFRLHTLNIDTQTEKGKTVSIDFTGLLAHWFEHVVQDNILFGMDEICVGGFFEQYKNLLDRTIPYGFPACWQRRRTARADGLGKNPGICHGIFPWIVWICIGSRGGNRRSFSGALSRVAIGNQKWKFNGG